MIELSDPLDLRRALGTFATGVTIVTSLDGQGAPLGFTANSFTSVSLDPPLLLVCIAKTAAGCPTFVAAPHFAINVLAEDQRETSNLFAKQGADKFADIEWHTHTTGCPLLPGVVGWFDCVAHDTVEAGDHDILIGRVVAYGHNQGSPLGYCRGAYVSFSLPEGALSAPSKVRVGAIVERDGALLFQVESNDAPLKLPTARHYGLSADPKSLLGKLFADGIDIRLPFLFSSYEDGGTEWLYFRGEIGSILQDDGVHQLPPGYRLIPFPDIPWDRVTDPAVHSMLRRYVYERANDRFGIYLGDSRSGDVQRMRSR